MSEPVLYNLQDKRTVEEFLGDVERGRESDGALLSDKTVTTRSSATADIVGNLATVLLARSGVSSPVLHAAANSVPPFVGGFFGSLLGVHKVPSQNTEQSAFSTFSGSALRDVLQRLSQETYSLKRTEDMKPKNSLLISYRYEYPVVAPYYESHRPGAYDSLSSDAAALQAIADTTSAVLPQTALGRALFAGISSVIQGGSALFADSERERSDTLRTAAGLAASGATAAAAQIAGIGARAIPLTAAAYVGPRGVIDFLNMVYNPEVVQSSVEEYARKNVSYRSGDERRDAGSSRGLFDSIISSAAAAGSAGLSLLSGDVLNAATRLSPSAVKQVRLSELALSGYEFLPPQLRGDAKVPAVDVGVFAKKLQILRDQAQILPDVVGSRIIRLFDVASERAARGDSQLNAIALNVWRELASNTVDYSPNEKASKIDAKAKRETLQRIFQMRREDTPAMPFPHERAAVFEKAYIPLSKAEPEVQKWTQNVASNMVNTFVGSMRHFGALPNNVKVNVGKMTQDAQQIVYMFGPETLSVVLGQFITEPSNRVEWQRNLVDMYRSGWITDLPTLPEFERWRAQKSSQTRK